MTETMIFLKFFYFFSKLSSGFYIIFWKIIKNHSFRHPQYEKCEKNLKKNTHFLIFFQIFFRIFSESEYYVQFTPPPIKLMKKT